MIPWTEERISEDKHFIAIGSFICGADDPLNLFLSDRALDYDKRGLGHTYVFTYNGEILAYYTIKVNGIQISNDETKEIDAVPMIEIARFAVARDLQGKGLGKRIFYDYILPKVIKVSKIVAVSGIMVFAEPHNISAIKFYEAIGFRNVMGRVKMAINETFNEECLLFTVPIPPAMD